MTKQLELQSAAGQVAAQLFRNLKRLINPGLNILDIEKFVTQEINKAQMKPAFKGYKGYPAASCIAVNEEVVHAIPADRRLTNGDIVTVDLGINNQGWLIDAARTFPVGQIDPQTEHFLATTERALLEASKIARAGLKVGDLSAVIQKIVEQGGYYIIEELTGHGIGRSLQQPPSIPNHGRAGQGPTLNEGQTIALEPITATKKTALGLKADGWTLFTLNGSLSCQFEDTLYLTDQGCIVLTRD